MIDLAKALAEHAKKKHNGSWVLLFCDNLVAHVSKAVKAIFAVSEVFLCYFLSNTTESTKPIDAGYSRSLRCKIRDLLDA